MLVAFSLSGFSRNWILKPKVERRILICCNGKNLRIRRVKAKT